MLTSGISAEYGRFSGGVVNAITKSGGNTFSGSVRANLWKPTWTAQNPYEVETEVPQEGDIADNVTCETTLGGPIVLDRLWFFGANRIPSGAADRRRPKFPAGAPCRGRLANAEQLPI